MITKKESIKRLTILRDALLNMEQTRERLVLPEGKSPEKFVFNLSVFGIVEPSCSTTACAFGVAAMLPELRERGLSYTVLKDGDWEDADNTFTFSYNDERGDFSVAREFFGTEYTDYVFDPCYYPPDQRSSKDVAGQLTLLIENIKNGTRYVPAISQEREA